MMMENVSLWGIDNSDENEIKIELFCDEIKPQKNRNKETWFYIGVLIIPFNKKEEVLNKLNDCREEVGYFDELHFTKLKNFSYANKYNKKTLLAKRWFELVLSDKETQYFYFNVLGINCDNLVWSRFGNKKSELFQNAYNRFFRTAVKGAINNFFPNKKVIIHNIYHDQESQLQMHKYFDWQLISNLLQSQDNIVCLTQKILHINSNHIKEKDYKNESHFIQLIDLILGAFRQAFDDPNKKDGCIEIGKLSSYLWNNLLQSRSNREYGYFRKYSFSFFPSRKVEHIKRVDEINVMFSPSLFYYNRELLLAHRDQIPLFKV